MREKNNKKIELKVNIQKHKNKKAQQYKNKHKTQITK